MPLLMEAPPMPRAAKWELADAGFASIPSFQKSSKLWGNNSAFEPTALPLPLPLRSPDSPLDASAHNALTDDASSNRDSGEERSPQLQRGAAHALVQPASASGPARGHTSLCATSPRPAPQASPRPPMFRAPGLFKQLTGAASATSRTSVKEPEHELSSPVVPFHQALDEELEQAPGPPPPSYISSPADLIVGWELELRRMMNAGNMLEEALDRPGPSAGMVRCYVRRNKSFFSANCTFQMHLQSSNQLLLAARKRKKSKVSAYVISTDAEDLKRDSSSCTAKLKANFVGTEYVLWGRSKNKSTKKGFGAEQLCLSFKPSTMEGGPHTMHAVVPVPEGEWRPEASAERGSDQGAAGAGHAPSQLGELLEQAKQRSLGPTAERQLALMCSKPPDFDEALKEFYLDFGGRVKLHSVKNMQLVCWDQGSDVKGSQVILQFGKVAEDHYVLDFAYPLCAKTAFGLALAKLDTKLCYMLG